MVKGLRWRIHNAFIFVYGIFFVLINGKATRKPKKFERVVVFQNAKMGDMVCTTPVFRALKKTHPDIRLCVVGDPLNHDLLKDNPDVDEYIVFEGVMDCARKIRMMHFDAGFLVAPSPDGLAALLFSKTPFVVAPRVEGGKLLYETSTYRLLSKFVAQAPHVLGQYAAREYLKILEPIGITEMDTKKHLDYSDWAEEAVKKFFAVENILAGSDCVVGVAPSAGNKVKIWPADRFAKVVEHLHARGAKIVIIGGGRDRKEVDGLKGFLGKDIKYLDAFGRFSIDELKAFISKLSLLIAPDTGVVYIAEAFGVPTVDIVGPVDDADQPPRGEFHAIVKAPRKKAAMGVLQNKGYDPKEVRRQIEDISVEMVCNAVDAMLSKIKKC